MIVRQSRTQIRVLISEQSDLGPSLFAILASFVNQRPDDPCVLWIIFVTIGLKGYVVYQLH